MADVEDIKDILFEAREELKRLEHIIYVSLKYTRTVDVIINALNRLVNIYDLIVEALLEKAKIDEKFIASFPKSPALRVKRIKEIYSEDKEMQKFLSFYAFLKRTLNLPHTKRREFRRHVTLVVEMDHSTAEVNIDNLTNCEKFAHNFLIYSKETIFGKVEEED